MTLEEHSLHRGIDIFEMPVSPPPGWPQPALHRRSTLLLAMLALIIVQAASTLVLDRSALEGGLVGPDSYMRVHRVVQLFEQNHRYDPFYPRANAPFGDTLLQWSRLLDAILLAGAWLGSFVSDFRQALLVWGMVISPLMLLALVPIWSWGTRLILGCGPFVLSLVLVALLPQLNLGFTLGRPDHHGLLSFLFFAQLAILFRIALGDVRPRLALAAGAVGGLAVWVSVEGLLHLAYYAAALAIFWIWRGGQFRRHVPLYLLGVLVAVTVSIGFERPPAIRDSPPVA